MKKNWVLKLLDDAWSICFWVIFAWIIIILLAGCSTRTQHITKVEEVYIPVKCEVARLPEKPKLQENIFHTLNDVLIYAEQLKVIVDGCVVESNTNVRITDTIENN